MRYTLLILFFLFMNSCDSNQKIFTTEGQAYKRVSERVHLGTSTDQGELFNKKYEVEDIQFRESDFSYLSDLKDEELLNGILSQLTAVKKTALGGYQTSEGLSLMYKIKEDHIMVISLGEARREVYMFYVEGVWKK